MHYRFSLIEYMFDTIQLIELVWPVITQVKAKLKTG